MTLFKFLSIISLSLLLSSCGNNSEAIKKDLSIVSNAKNKVIKNDETLSLSINNPKNHNIESVRYTLNGKDISNNLSLALHPLGKYDLDAHISLNGKEETISQEITILNATPPKIYTFNIVNEYPHDITSYTQGLEFHNGELYESTGQRGQSKLRKVNYKTGDVLQNVDLAKEYFGEGLTILNNTIYQLTWQRGVGFTYDLNTMERKGSFKYGKSKEGWGLCNDGTKLFKSDGTEYIWFLDPDTLVEKDHIQAYTNNGKIVGLNELELIDGKLYANRYQKNGVAIINPKNGAIEAVIDFTSLRSKVTQHQELDVLNGIAYNPDTNTIFVTGKNWDKLFEVEIVKQ